MNKKIYSGILVVLVALAAIGTAAALTSKSITRSDVDLVDAGLQASDSTVYYIMGMESQYGTDIGVQMCGSDYVCRYGYIFTTEDILSVDKKLTAATLTIDQITLYDDWGGNPPVTLNNVKLTLTSDGNVLTDKYRGQEKGDGFRFTTNGRTLSTLATATISIDGSNIEATNIFGDIAHSKSATMYMQK